MRCPWGERVEPERVVRERVVRERVVRERLTPVREDGQFGEPVSLDLLARWVRSQFAVRGLLGHVEANNTRSVLLFAGFALALQIVGMAGLAGPLLILDRANFPPFNPSGYSGALRSAALRARRGGVRVAAAAPRGAHPDGDALSRRFAPRRAAGLRDRRAGGDPCGRAGAEGGRDRKRGAQRLRLRLVAAARAHRGDACAARRAGRRRAFGRGRARDRAHRAGRHPAGWLA